MNGFGQSLGDQDMILSLDPLQDKVGWIDKSGFDPFSRPLGLKVVLE